MNFKLVVKKGTSPSEVRYCENFTSNLFLLKYFHFSCSLCCRLTSHIWVSSSCRGCALNFKAYQSVKGACHDCCVQIQGALKEKMEEIST